MSWRLADSLRQLVGLYSGDLHTDDLTLLNDLRSTLGSRVGLTVTDIT